MAYIGTKPSNSPLTSELIPDGLIGTSDIANSAISSAKIADGSITQAKLATGVAGNGPAFSATLSSNQTVSSGVWTKVQFNTEQFDTNTNYDSSTNYRFTPTVAGYYQINLTITGGTTAAYQSIQVAIYKNGSQYSSSQNYLSGNYYWGGSASTSAVIYFNGSTDYVESYGFLAGSGTLTFNASDVGSCRFSGSMIRTA